MTKNQNNICMRARQHNQPLSIGIQKMRKKNKIIQFEQSYTHLMCNSGIFFIIRSSHWKTEAPAGFYYY